MQIKGSCEAILCSNPWSVFRVKVACESLKLRPSQRQESFLLLLVKSFNLARAVGES